MRRLTRDEAARMAGCSPRTLSRAVRRGALGATVDGRRLLFDPREVRAFAQSRERRGDPLSQARAFVTELLQREIAGA
jgi:excisionase family DNA binding protein